MSSIARACVAAGHPRTAEAGAEVLRAGGNAVDAAIAAVAVSFIAEPVLTGAGGGGFMLIREPDGRATLLDGFARMPHTPASRRDALDFRAAPVDFGDTVQTFHVGRASVAAPGLMRMLFDAHREHGRMPIRDVLAPAMQTAREGVPLNALQASFIRLLAPILNHEDACRQLHAPQGKPPDKGEMFRNPDLAATLEILAIDGVDEMYRGDIARAVIAAVSQGGLLSMRDMENVATLRRPPLSATLTKGTLLTNPPPSAGGLLIAFSLMLLERLRATPPVKERNLPWRILLAETMRAASMLRMQAGAPEKGGIAAASALTPGTLNHWTNVCLQHIEKPQDSCGDREASDRHGSTTHISVIDREGRAVSITTSNGEGSGIVVPGTGLHLNNMLGEEDINPGGFHRLPLQATLPSMMAPSILVRDGRPAMILGSGGSNRLRGAIMQVLYRHVWCGMPVAKAVAAPRIHPENGMLDCEPGALDERETALATALGWRVRPWREISVYFGGVHAIALDEQGETQAGGDPRRGGAAAWA